MVFNASKCAIPTVYCGKGAPPKRKASDTKYYTGTGSRYDCMRKGFGAGTAIERAKHLPVGSLQHIKYVGVVYEGRFKSNNIRNIRDLLTEAERKTKAQIKRLLRRVFMRRKGGLDKRAYNSTILYLYQHGIGHVPSCSRILP